MSTNQIAERLAINTNQDMHWIVISENQCESEYLKAIIPSKHRARGTFVYPLSELVQSRSKLASDVTKAAANSMLFTLILDGEIRDIYMKYLYQLFFHLKNLGFCRVIVTHGGDEKIADFCEELNVYYEAFDTDKTFEKSS